MIQGFNVGNYLVNSRNIKRLHIKELYSFDLYLGEKFVGRCFYFKGRDYYKPWLEIDYIPWPRNENLEVELFKIINKFLGSSGKIFVTYIRDSETKNQLLKSYHPAETSLGFSLLKAGFTWFKDWYFTEGGNEGAPKIQANSPENEEVEYLNLKTLLEEVKRSEVKNWIENRIANLRKS